MEPLDTSLIHFERVPEGVCSRKDTKADEFTIKNGATSVTFTSVSHFHGNVTCSRCKQWMKANKQKKERMEKDAKTRVPLSYRVSVPIITSPTTEIQ